MDGKFQTPLPEGDPLLNGKIKAEVYEVGGTAPKTVIGTDQDWYVKVEWEFNGVFVVMIGGKWQLQVHLESMGPGNDYSIPDPAKVVTLNQGNSYTYKVDIRAGEVDQGSYKLVATLNYTDLIDKPGPIAGYVEGPILQFFEP